MKLNVKAFALARGIVWVCYWFCIIWWLMLTKGITHEKVAFISDTYVGFTVSPLGSLVALAYGFIDGLIIGLMVAWVYNKIAPRLRSEN